MLLLLHLLHRPTPYAAAAGGEQAAGLAAAIAVVSCEGGASAEAYAKALSQVVEKDKKTECDVLVTAKSYAFAKCGPSGAFAEAGSTITKVGLSSFCKLGN
jgi:hypothetical protein